jgi:hypothetical protein
MGTKEVLFSRSADCNHLLKLQDVPAEKDRVSVRTRIAGRKVRGRSGQTHTGYIGRMALRLIVVPIRSAKVIMVGIWYELSWVVVWTG